MSFSRKGSDQVLSCFRGPRSPSNSPTRPARQLSEKGSARRSNTARTPGPTPVSASQPRTREVQDVSASISRQTASYATAAKPKDGPTHKDQAPEVQKPKYILTLKTSNQLHEEMTALRKKYFPPERNKLDAHITLFHALTDLDVVRKDLTNLSRFTSPFRLSTHRPQLRGNFILVRMDQGVNETCSLRALLRDKWSTNFEMSSQDLQLSKLEPRPGRNASWEAHWTIVNKQPDKEKAKQSFDELDSDFVPKEGMAEGLSLWEYETGGTWRHEHDWLFKGGQSEGRQ